LSRRIRALLYIALAITLVLTALLQVAAQPDVTVPADWQATLLSDCDTTLDFTAGRQPFAVGQLYDSFSVQTEPGARIKGASLKWRAIPKQAPPMLCSAFCIDSHCQAISLWVKNPEGHQVGLALSAVETDGSRYRSSLIPLGDRRGWRELVFNLQELALAPGSFDENGQLDFPLTRIQLCLANTVPGQASTLYFDEIHAHWPAPPEVMLQTFDTSAQVAAGDVLTMRCTAQAAGSAPLARIRLRLSLAGSTLALKPLTFEVPPAQWQPGQTVTAKAAISLPALAALGEYEATLEGINCSLVPAEGVNLSQKVQVTGAVQEPASLRVAGLPSQPHLRLSDEVIPALIARPSAVDRRLLARLNETGCRLLMLDTTCSWDPYGVSPDVWLSGGRFDFSALDERIAATIAAAPDARLLLRVFIESPPWWDAAHPGELAVFADANGRLSTVNRAGIIGRKATTASWASELWWKQGSVALVTFIEHITSAPYANYVVGYQLAAGERGDWVCWGTGQGLYSDYSPPGAVAFRKALQSYYGNLAELRSAWGQPRVPYDTPEALQETDWIRNWAQVQVPIVAERALGRRFAIWDPAITRQVSDHQVFQAGLTAQMLSYMAKAARQAAGPDKLIGAAYGHLLAAYHQPAAIQNSGHLALFRLLETDELDFLTGPSVANRGQMPLATTATDTVRSRERLWLPVSSDVPEQLGLAQRLLVAEGALLMNLSPDGDDQAIAELVKLADDVARAPRQPAEIALVLDDVSACYLASDTNLAQGLLCDQARLLDEIGAPFDVVSLADLVAGELPPYKFYIFPDAFVLDHKQRMAVRHYAMRDGQLCLWLYAPGGIDEALTGQNMKELTGLTLSVLSSKRLPARIVMSGGHPLFSPNISGSLEFGLEGELVPLLMATGAGCDILGTIQGTSWGGMSAVHGEDFTSVHSTVPGLPPGLLRSLALAAGCWLPTDRPCYMVRRGELMVIQALQSPPCLLFDTPVDIFRAGQRMDEGVTEARLDLSPGQTVVLRVHKAQP